MKNKIINISIIFGGIFLMIFFFFSVFTFLHKSVSNEDVSGIIFQPQNWSGIIIIKSDVFIVPWVALTITPGTKVLFEKDFEPDGSDWTKWADTYIKEHNDPTGKEGYQKSHFDITGKIIALGTKENPIIFTSAQTKKEYADWDQLVLFSGSKLENVELSFAHNGVNIEGKGVNIKNNKIYNSLWSGIDVFGTDNVIEGNEIYHCWHQAIGFKVIGRNIVQNNYLHDSQLSVNCEFGANPEVKNNHFKSAPYSEDCPQEPSNEIIEALADSEGGTYNGRLIYPSGN